MLTRIENMETAEQFIDKKNRVWTTELSDPKYKGIPMKDIGRLGRHHYKRAAWTFMVQTGLPEKIFVIERLKKIHVEGETAYGDRIVGEVEYRLGYYMLGRIGRMNGRWTWGQYCPLIPLQDFPKLIEKAKKEGTLL